MPARSPEKIFVSFQKKQFKEAKMRRKLVANKDRNWLLALILHSFEKLDANEALTPLEQTFVDAFVQNGFTNAQLKQQGHLYHEMSVQLRNEIFPSKFAELTPQSAYAVQDLKQDAPEIVTAVLSMKNVTNLDVSAVDSEAAHSSEFPMVSRTVLRAHGAAGYRWVAPNTTPPTAKYTIKATRFRCNDETGSDWSGSDEPYWIFGSVGSGTAITTRSKIFADVDTGDSRDFATNEGCIWGQNCAAQVLPEGEIGTLISLYDHDEGDPTQVKAAFSAAFSAASSILAASGIAAWVGVIVIGVGALLQWLLGFLDEDHIADQTIVFTRQVIEQQLPKANSSMNITRRFADGDGDYTLTIKISRVT